MSFWSCGGIHWYSVIGIGSSDMGKTGAFTICTENLECNARNGTGFSRCGISPNPTLSRLEENNNKSKWRLHLQCRKAGKEEYVNRVEWEFTNGTGFFRSFRLERVKRNTSEDFHLFRKLSGGI